MKTDTRLVLDRCMSRSSHFLRYSPKARLLYNLIARVNRSPPFIVIHSSHNVWSEICA